MKMFKINFDDFLILAGLIIGSILFGMLYFVEIPVNNEKIIYMGLGTIIGAIIVTPFAYKYGSSAGSKKKDEIISETVKQQQKV